MNEDDIKAEAKRQAEEWFVDERVRRVAEKLIAANLRAEERWERR